MTSGTTSAITSHLSTNYTIPPWPGKPPTAEGSECLAFGGTTCPVETAIGTGMLPLIQTHGTGTVFGIIFAPYALLGGTANIFCGFCAGVVGSGKLGSWFPAFFLCPPAMSHPPRRQNLDQGPMIGREKIGSRPAGAYGGRGPRQGRHTLESQPVEGEPHLPARRNGDPGGDATFRSHSGSQNAQGNTNMICQMG